MDEQVLKRLVILCARSLECRDCPCAIHIKGKQAKCSDPLYCGDILLEWVKRGK